MKYDIMSMNLYYPKTIGLISTGLFAGFSLCLNFVNVPSIRASKDPLPVFCKTYSNGARFAIVSIFIGAASNALCYYYTRKTNFLYSSLLMFAVPPFTIAAIAPTNNKLFAMESQGDNYDRKKVYDLVAKWNKLQWVRTTCGITAFLFRILY
ncbi:MAG: hypothetical protein EXX96DRAFT_548130 [Benjaminiella poitrasii]|nr:MAG: hypothetical protein EXX96DRAFT_548130 [Benjaminiella poitrasii]